jgi:hypothetical protein
MAIEMTTAQRLIGMVIDVQILFEECPCSCLLFTLWHYHIDKIVPLL